MAVRTSTTGGFGVYKPPTAPAPAPAPKPALGGTPVTGSIGGIYNAEAGSTSYSPANPEYADAANYYSNLYNDRAREDSLAGAAQSREDSLLSRERANQLTDRRELIGLLGLGGGGGGVATGPGLQAGGGGGATGGGTGGTSPDATAARAAAFARAKDQAGQNARASLSALENIMGGRGMLGSGYEAKGMADVAAHGTSELNDFTREQLGEDLDYERHLEDRRWQSGENAAQRAVQMATASQGALAGLLGRLY